MLVVTHSQSASLLGIVLRSSSQNRKTRRCQRYSNESGRLKNGVQPPPGIQNVLEELTPVPEAGLTSAAVPVLWPAEEGNSCGRSIRNHETQRACRARKVSHPESGWELVVRNISVSEGPAFLAAYLPRFNIYASVYNVAIKLQNLMWNSNICSSILQLHLSRQRRSPLNPSGRLLEMMGIYNGFVLINCCNDFSCYILMLLWTALNIFPGASQRYIIERESYTKSHYH